MGIYGLNGNLVIDPKYDRTRGFYEGLAPVMTRKKNSETWTFIDKEGNTVIDTEF